MDNIINRAYVINLKDREDRWDDINQKFSKTNLKLIRSDAVDGKNLSEDDIKKHTTKFCNNFCSKSMIGCALSHYNLWKQIADNNEDNVLILEDDAYPIDNFDEILKRYWKSIPDDWDIIYFGCFGSCDASIFERYISYMYSRKINKSVYKNGILQKNIIRPAFPLGFHAYMLSNKGAKKLTENKIFDKIDYHIDNMLSTHMLNKKDFNAYAFTPPLIRTNMSSQYSNNQLSSHPIFSSITEDIKVSDNHTLDALGCLVILHIRKIGFDITFLNLFLFITSFMIGLLFPAKKASFFTFITSYYISESMFVNKSKIRGLILELLIIYVTYITGEALRYNFPT